MRLIDADDLMCKLTELEITNPNFVMAEVKGLLVNAPTVEERKHGHWIGKPIAGYSIVRCSVCFAFANNIERWNYCPNCGAKMDEVTKQ